MEYPLTYAVKHKNFNIRIMSRSGGIFTALSDSILTEGGVIYGCSLDNNYCAVHRRATNKSERDLFRGSKYIQSNLNNILIEVKKDIISGIHVMFSGTSCQISCLKKFLSGLNTSNLICVDIVCHGVPSPEVWINYLKYFENKYNGSITSVEFRNKIKYGWKDHVETISVNNKEIDRRSYRKLFYSHNILRPSCYQCPYKAIMHPGDITIADCWGIEEAVPGFSDNKGVSLVLVNNDKGMNLFRKIVSNIDVVVCDIAQCMQTPFISPFKEPDERTEFWNDYRYKDFNYIIKKYAREKMKEKIKTFIKRIV